MNRRNFALIPSAAFVLVGLALPLTALADPPSVISPLAGRHIAMEPEPGAPEPPAPPTPEPREHEPTLDGCYRVNRRLP